MLKLNPHTTGAPSAPAPSLGSLEAPQVLEKIKQLIATVQLLRSEQACHQYVQRFGRSGPKQGIQGLERAAARLNSPMLLKAADPVSRTALAFFANGLLPGHPNNPPLPPPGFANGVDLVKAQEMISCLNSQMQGAVAVLLSGELNLPYACDILEWTEGNPERLKLPLAQASADVVARWYATDINRVTLNLQPAIKLRLQALPAPACQRIASSPFVIKQRASLAELLCLEPLELKTAQEKTCTAAELTLSVLSTCLQDLRSPDIKHFLKRGLKQLPAMSGQIQLVAASVKLLSNKRCVQPEPSLPSRAALLYVQHVLHPGDPRAGRLPAASDLRGADLVEAETLLASFESPAYLQSLSWMMHAALGARLSCEILLRIGQDAEQLKRPLAQTACDHFARWYCTQGGHAAIQHDPKLLKQIRNLNTHACLMILGSSWMSSEKHAKDLWSDFNLSHRFDPSRVDADLLMSAVRSATFWQRKGRPDVAGHIYLQRKQGWGAIPRSNQPFTTPELWSSTLSFELQKIKPLFEDKLAALHHHFHVGEQAWRLELHRISQAGPAAMPLLELRLEPQQTLEQAQTAKLRISLGRQPIAVEAACNQGLPLRLRLNPEQMSDLISLPLKQLVAELRISL